jgi:hypothetical protein
VRDGITLPSALRVNSLVLRHGEHFSVRAPLFTYG